MKGTVNGSFLAQEKGEEVRSCDSIELEDVYDSSRAIRLSDSNAPEPKLDNVNKVAKFIIKFRKAVWDLLVGRSSTGFFGKFLTVGASLALLGASIFQYIQSDSPNIEWCDGVGFFWVLYILAYLGVLYYQLKRWIGKPLTNFVRKSRAKAAPLLDSVYFRGTCYVLPVVVLGAYVIIFPGRSRRRIFSFLGILIFTVFGFMFSKYPGHVRWRTVLSGIFCQFILGVLGTNWDGGRNALDCIGSKVTKFLLYSESGSSFVYGPLANPPDETQAPIFAFSVLPVIFFLSFFINILNYYGILQWFIMGIGFIVKGIMGTTICESVNAAASIFLGMTETPLLIKNYLKDLTRSEMCAVLCAGWSTVAGVVLAAYIKFGVKASHLISASVMSAPASLSYSKLFFPETEKSKNTLDNIVLEREVGFNALDAATKGAMSAISVVFSIIANIIAILSLLAFVDGVLGWLGSIIGIESLSAKLIMSQVFIPVSFLIGVEMDELDEVAYLIGIKTIANEFQAYKILGDMINENRLSERSEILATYVLCGFSNIGSIGISVGAIAAIEPSQQPVVAEVAFRAFVSANIVCFMTACIIGCIID